MMLKKQSGVILVIFLLTPLFLSGAQKSQKIYEIIYEDLQALKEQIALLQKKVDQNSQEILFLKEQLKEFLSQFRLFQAEQTSLRGELKLLPFHYQALVEKVEILNAEVLRISSDLLRLKGAPLLAEEAQAKKETQPPTPEKGKKEEEKKEKALEEKAQTLPVPSLSPQEVYNMAYADYLKGNFDLAIDGFRLYQEQFPESPLADNALYWIGECYFSQRNFEEAINSFNDLILNYPQGDKTPAAYLKKGMSLMELKKNEEALAVFKLLVAKYPFEEETKIAQEKIKEITKK